MKAIGQIRQHLGARILTQRASQLMRHRQFNNLQSARSVGVLFDATRLDSFYVARDFILELRNKGLATHGLGYALTKEAAAFFRGENAPTEPDIDVFSVQNVNWYCKPNNPVADNFCQHEFDLLIDLSPGRELPLMFVVGLSRAKLKIGHPSSYAQYYDITLQQPGAYDPKGFLAQLKHYLLHMQTKRTTSQASKSQF